MQPGAEELAAIAAAFFAVTRARAPSARAEPSRWGLAGRLPELDESRVRFVARSASAWNAAGRLDD